MDGVEYPYADGEEVVFGVTWGGTNGVVAASIETGVMNLADKYNIALVNAYSYSSTGSIVSGLKVYAFTPQGKSQIFIQLASGNYIGYHGMVTVKFTKK